MEEAASQLAAQVVAYYQEHQHRLPDRQRFHFNSRLWLWTGDEGARRYLSDQHQWFLDESDAAVCLPMRQRRFLKVRLPYFQRYPALLPLERKCFLSLYGTVLYDKPRVAWPGKTVQRSARQLWERLLNQPDDVALLASPAVNFTLLAPAYLPTLGRTLDPWVVAADFVGRLDSADTMPSSILQLILYGFTHTILCASRYYAQLTVPAPPRWQPLFTVVEAVVERHFNRLPLDLKFELLVCARLAGVTSVLTRAIAAEALASRHPTEYFVVDERRPHGATVQEKFIRGEHRNVLFMMAFQPSRSGQATSVLP